MKWNLLKVKDKKTYKGKLFQDKNKARLVALYDKRASIELHKFTNDYVPIQH